jgi:hypothetical protein
MDVPGILTPPTLSSHLRARNIPLRPNRAGRTTSQCQTETFVDGAGLLPWPPRNRRAAGAERPPRHSPTRPAAVFPTTAKATPPANAKHTKRTNTSRSVTTARLTTTRRLQVGYSLLWRVTMVLRGKRVLASRTSDAAMLSRFRRGRDSHFGWNVLTRDCQERPSKPDLSILAERLVAAARSGGVAMCGRYRAALGCPLRSVIVCAGSRCAEGRALCTRAYLISPAPSP